MTEREKMLSGERYDPTDKELEQLRLNARKLTRKYNLTDEDQPKSKHRYCKNYCQQQRSFRICRHLFILITDAILSLENSVLLILILHV